MILLIVALFLNLSVNFGQLKAESCEINITKPVYHFDRFKESAQIQSDDIYKQASQDPIAFWEQQANALDWFEKWHTVLKSPPPFSEWFEGGKLNACFNCIDRHVDAGLGDKTAIIWQGEPGDERKLTYNELFVEVNKCANALKSLGIKKGETVAFYVSMVPEAIITLLACSRIGAPHVVIFGGIGASGVRDRLIDSNAQYLITVDGCFRRGKILSYKSVVDEALQNCETIKKVIIINRASNTINLMPERDYWYHDLLKYESGYCAPEPMNSEDLLFILYTSGSTGKSKGVMHSTAGYLTGICSTFKWVFDIKPDDIYWSTADIGWITGHNCALYGPLLNGATIIMYEGAPDYPDKDRIWQIVEQYKATIFYTAPTAIRMYMKWGFEHIQKHDISSLRLIGSIGEPINPKVWEWYYKNVGSGRCPIVDTWFQTETGALVISPIPGLTPLKPGSVTQALPGFDIAVLDEDGNEVDKGLLAIRNSYPSMMRGIYGDEERYKQTYWCKWGGKYYYTGDGAIKDKDGYIWITGRLDDVLKVAGHRIGTAEIENTLLEHAAVAEAAAIGVDDEIKGQEIVVFVVLKEFVRSQYNQDATSLELELKEKVTHGIGAFVRPRQIIFTDQLPKNRSGKIMRRLLRDLYDGKSLGDTTTLDNAEAINTLKSQCDKIDLASDFKPFYLSATFGNEITSMISQKIDSLLVPLTSNTRNPKSKYTLTAFDPENILDVKAISKQICTNFSERSEFADVPEDIKKLYCQANSEKGLVSTVATPGTYAYILKADGTAIGFLLVRFTHDNHVPCLQIRRMHTFFEASSQYFGVGKTLLNLLASIATLGGVKVLQTTAPYPIKGYFEKLKWNGNMIYTKYQLNDEFIELPQFKCSFNITDDFKGF